MSPPATLSEKFLSMSAPLDKSPAPSSPSPKRQKLADEVGESSMDAPAPRSHRDSVDSTASVGSADSTAGHDLAQRVAAFANGDGRRPRSDTMCSHKSEYDEKAAMYDSYRGASPGWAVMAPLLAGPEHGIEGKRVLDLGCGTGGFFGKLLSMKPASLTAYDVSESMIEKAKEKAAGFAAKGGAFAHIPIDVRCATTEGLADGSFDAIVCLQVLQNICPDPSDGRGETSRRAFMQEMRRLLVPGGGVMITTRYRKQPYDCAAEAEGAAAGGGDSSASTYGDLYWYADRAVLPRAVAFMEGAVPARPAQELADAGFEACVLHNSTDTMIRADAYFRGEILVDPTEGPSFQAADSFFSRLDDSERATLQAHIAALQEKGELKGYVERRDALRGKLGQVAVVVGRAQR